MQYTIAATAHAAAAIAAREILLDVKQKFSYMALDYDARMQTATESFLTSRRGRLS